MFPPISDGSICSDDADFAPLDFSSDGRSDEHFELMPEGSICSDFADFAPLDGSSDGRSDEHFEIMHGRAV
eukprot:7500417-Alexandrium_andersonii.AAC.1